MATNLIAVGNTPASASAPALVDGSGYNFALMTTTGTIPAEAVAIIYITTTGTDTEVARLTNSTPTARVAGAGTYKVVRIGGPTFGVDYN